MFILLDRINDLIPYRKERGKYWCPSCDGHNLSICPRTGKWNCWNDPTRHHRIEIIRKLVGETAQVSTYQSRPTPIVLSPIRLSVATLQGLKLPPLETLALAHHCNSQIFYQYSAQQRVVRSDWEGGKSFCPQHLDDGRWLNGAGSQPWLPYGIGRLQHQGHGLSPVLVVEGQKCVEIAAQSGISAVCLEGGDYSHLTIPFKLRAIQRQVGNPILIVLPDADRSGIDKAVAIAQVSRELGIPCAIIDPQRICQMDMGDDIEQMLSRISRKVFIRRLLQLTKQKLTTFN
jgi:putative DNA primase/helicase